MSNYLINGCEYPSVTKILGGVIDKSSALMQWAVNLALQYVRENIKTGVNSKAGDTDKVLTDAKYKYKELSQDAMDIGTEVHGLIEKYIKVRMDGGSWLKLKGLRKEVENAFHAFIEWEFDNIDTWLETEQPVFSESVGFAGTLDAIAKFKDGRVMVIDFKSSKGFYDGYGMQIAGYMQARIDCNGLKDVVVSSRNGEYKINYDDIIIDGCGVLRLDKKTGIPEWKDYTKVTARKWTAFECAVKYFYALKKRRLKNNKFVS